MSRLGRRFKSLFSGILSLRWLLGSLLYLSDVEGKVRARSKLSAYIIAMGLDEMV